MKKIALVLAVAAGIVGASMYFTHVAEEHRKAVIRERVGKIIRDGL